jgi:hypothetical protein
MLCRLSRFSTIYTEGSVQGEINKVDKAKRKHGMRNERVVAITLVVCRLSRQRACSQPCLQAGYFVSALCVHLAVSTLFVSPCTHALALELFLQPKCDSNSQYSDFSLCLLLAVLT